MLTVRTHLQVLRHRARAGEGLRVAAVTLPRRVGDTQPMVNVLGSNITGVVGSRARAELYSETSRGLVRASAVLSFVTQHA